MSLIQKWMSMAAVSLFAAFAFGTPAQAQDTPKLKSGERIIFLGDSITAQGAGKNGYVTLVRKALEEKYPDLKIEILGAGVSGNKVPDLQKRLEKDVISKTPTLVVIYIGINDVWHGEKDPAKGTSKEKFEAGLKEIIDKIQKAGGRVVLATPTVIGEKKEGANNLDKLLDEYSDISRSVAKETKSPLLDLREAFKTYLKDNNPDDKEKGILTGDRVHLNEAGNKFVAEQVLKVIDPK